MIVALSAGSTNVGALLDGLDAEDLTSLAERLRPHLTPAADSMDSDPYMTTEQAAEYLACGKKRLYDLASLDRIPHHRDGSRLLFRRSELDRWIADGGGKRLAPALTVLR